MNIAGIILLALIWGSSFLFIKIGLNGGMSPVLVATWRLAVGAAFMWLIVGIRQVVLPQSARKPLPRGRMIWQRLVLVGLFNNAIPFALIAWGETRISSGLASIFNSSMPIFTVIIAHLVTQDDRISPLKAFGIIVGLAGVAVVITPTAGDIGGELLGSLAVIGASLSYALATVYVKKHLTGTSDPTATGAGQLLTALLWLIPLCLATGALQTAQNLPLDAILAVSALGLLGTGLAYLIYYQLIQHAKASQISLVTYLLPVTALVWGALFLNEQINLASVVGFVLIVAGITLVNRANQTARVDAPAASTMPES